MATVVWHGFHSCSDQPKAELLPPPPLTALRLKLAPQKPADQLGGWRFQFHSLSLNTTDDVTPPALKPTTAYATAEGGNDAYAPPITLSSSVKVKLNEKSLEMCTENLGCETGSSDVISSDGSSSSFMSVNDDGKSPTTRNSTRQQSGWGRKVNDSAGGRSSCFPPPLTTMRCGGERVVLVRSHRSEQGRLVMDAVKCPYSARSNFVTDRSHGRLRLSLLLRDEPQPIIHSDDKLEIIRDDEAQLINKDTTLVNENQFRQKNFDINNIREKNHHIIREEELVDEKEEESESTAGRFQRLPTMSRCMEADSEHEHHHHHHHRHHTKQFINVRLNYWVATS